MSILMNEERQTRELVALALEEKKRRIKENGIHYYKPLDAERGENPALDFHKSTKRIRAAFGGNRSSKTVSGATEAVWYATGTHPYKNIPTPNYGRIVCTDFTNGIEKVIIPEFRKWLPKDALRGGRAGYNSESRTMYLKNGSTVEFMSYDQDVEKFASASRHWIWFDEEPPQNVFLECKMRVLDTRGDIWFTLTPDNGMTWIYSDIYEKAGIDPMIEIWHYDTRKNPYIDEESLEELTKGLTEAEIDRKLGGKFISQSGLIYRDYNREIHNIKRFPIPSHWPKICSIDPHPRTPTVVNYMSICPKAQFIHQCKLNDIKIDFDIRLEDVYIIYDEIYPSDPLLISEVCHLMHAKEGSDHIGYRLIDTSANQPTPIVGRTLKQEFEQYGIRTILADKDVSNGILKVRERIQANALFFMDIPKSEWEIRHYVWDDFKMGRDFKDPKEKPRKKRDHAMDNIRYMCVSCPRYEPVEMYHPPRRTICSVTGY